MIARLPDLARPACLFAAAALAAAVCAATPPRPAGAAEADELRAYIGKLPFSGVGGRSLFNVLRPRARLLDLVGGRNLAAMERWNVTSEIEEHDGWLVAHGCRPHWYNSDNFVIAVNLADWRVAVCLAADNRPSGSRRPAGSRS